MKRICLFVLLCILCLSPTAFAVQLGKIAAVVNGKVITMYDLQRAAAPELRRMGANTPKAVDSVMRKVLDDMIIDILVGQEAKRLKITVSPSEVDAKLAEIMKANRFTKKQFESVLAKEGLTIAEFRKNIERRLLNQRVLGVEVGRRTIVTPEEVKKYYDEHKDKLYDRKGLHMGLLIYHPKAPADAVGRQVQRGELSFANACAKYSILNREKGCDTGPVNWDRLIPEFDKRLTTMKPGTVSDVFLSQGYKAQLYLFKPGGGEARILTLQEATPLITEILRQPKSKDRFLDYSTQLKKKAVIDIRL